MSDVVKWNNKTVYPIIFEVDYGQMKSINCYLYDNGETLTLIDAGLAIEAYNLFFDAKLAEYGFTKKSIDQIVLTHHHEDHTGQVNRILKEHDVPVYAHHLAIERLKFDEQYLENKRDFFMNLYECYGCIQEAVVRMEQLNKTLMNRKRFEIRANVQPLYAGDVISGLKVFEVPGHSPDSILLYDEETEWQFVGDLVLNPGASNAIIDFDDNMELLLTVAQQENSLRMCQQLQASVVFAGHQWPFSNLSEVVDSKLAGIHKKSERIIEQIKKGNTQAMPLAKAIYGNLVEKQFSLVMSEIIGYLCYAEMKGFLIKTEQQGIWHFAINE